MATADLYQKLDGQPNTPEDVNYVTKFLLNELPRNDSKSVVKDLGWKFHLARNFPDPHPKNLKRKKTFLTRKQRLDLEILKLPKSGWDHGSLEPMRCMWREYMEENLSLAGAAPPSTRDADWGAFSDILTKSELIGAEIRVTRSKVPSQVGLNGTVVLETKQTFQIVTPASKLKIVGKASSVFVIEVNGLKFTIFGKRLVKPSKKNTNAKKVANQKMLDLL